MGFGAKSNYRWTMSNELSHPILKGKRVIVVEDEFAVLLMLEDVLASFGCVVADTASKLEDAMEKAGRCEVDAALLDINLAGKKIYPAAEIFRQRNVPIVFSTGYGLAGIEPEWAHCSVLQKPFRDEDLAKALITVFS